MRLIHILTSIILVLLFSIEIHAQTQISITDDDLNTCEGNLFHGDETGPYAPGMDETITICPDGSETILNLYWITYALGDGDKIIIHDGPDTSSPTITIDGQGGAAGFTGSSLFLRDVTSTGPSGCLTLHFISNSDESVGQFGALVSCGAPCYKPYAVFEMEGEGSASEVLVCKDETITFNASATTFPSETTFQSVIWDFGDGTTNTSAWPNVNKMYSESGAYRVTLKVTNSDGCQSANLSSIVVKVATIPEITATSDDYLVCVGQEFNLSGAVSAVSWTGAPHVDFGNALFLPDTQGSSFRDTIEVTNFQSGQIVQSITDILRFQVNMEHSFIGDLIISFICPNGSSLLVHQQGGSGTWLGIPCDSESNPNQPGTPADYGWSPTATNPTWASTTGANTIGVTDPCSGNGQSLISDDYAAVGDWNALLGCPLNGNWVMQVIDNWNIDNGFIFGWSVQFDPSLYPEDLSFTPTFGASCDSTYWLGSNIVDQGVSCDNVVVVPTAAGPLQYSYVAIDNHGCVYSQPVTVQAYDGPRVSVEDDFYYCGDQLEMSGVVTNPQPGMQYVYSWNNSSYLTNPNVASTNIQADAFTETTEFVLSVYPIDDADCLVRDTVMAIVPLYPPFAPYDSIRVCKDEEGLLIAATPDQSPYSYQWLFSSDSTNFSALSGQTFHEIEVDEQGFYLLEVTEPHCGFMTPSNYWVEVISCEIIIPDVFTPDGDGKNDTFQVMGAMEFPGSRLVVYNRWGQIVYEDDNYRNNWTGGELPEGVYYYIVEINKKSGKESSAGYVRLARK